MCDVYQLLILVTMATDDVISVVSIKMVQLYVGVMKDTHCTTTKPLVMVTILLRLLLLLLLLGLLLLLLLLLLGVLLLHSAST